MLVFGQHSYFAPPFPCLLLISYRGDGQRAIWREVLMGTGRRRRVVGGGGENGAVWRRYKTVAKLGSSQF